MSHRVSATLVDRSLTVHDVVPPPVLVEFTFDGSCWFEALDQLVNEYSAQFRGGRRIDAELIDLRSCCIICDR